MPDNRTSLHWLIVLAAGVVVSIAAFPARWLGGCLFYFILTSTTFGLKPVRRIIRTRLLPFIPAIIIFGILPYLISLVSPQQGEPIAELLFGLAIVLKSFSILFLVSTFVAYVSVSQTLKALHHLRVPPRIIFLLMVAYRFLFMFLHETRQLLEARTLRLFGRTHLTRLRSTIRTILRKALNYSESIYIAMRLRGGNASLPLLASYPDRTRATVLSYAGLLSLLMPYIIYLFALVVR